MTLVKSVPRSVIDRTGVELTDFSASRLGVASRCGLAFEYQYIRQLPAPFDRARTIFGTVVHRGVQLWYGPDEAPIDHTGVDLVPLVLAQWQTVLPPVVWEKVLHMRDLDEECEAVAAAVLFKRPQIKSPRTTVEFLNSSAAKAFAEAKTEMLEFCDALEEIKWSKDEDPYKAYRKSAVIAKRIEERWKPLPRPLAVERPFIIEFDGFKLRGAMDQFRVDPAYGTRAAYTGVLDIKTGTQPLSPMEAFIQMWMYDKAASMMDDLPESHEIAFYLARPDKFQQGRIDPTRHDRLASRVLNGRARQIAMGQFEPSYGHWCKLCDFNDLCAAEIALWEGDGLTTELLAS